jgi:AAA15 family ATPase/GTPase
MKILEYQYRDVEELGWNFDRLKFGRINLLVGNTATGKSRLLNTIFNLGRFAVAKEFKNGSWDLMFEHAGNVYSWKLKTEYRMDERKPGVIISEYIWKHQGEDLHPLVERDVSVFAYEGNSLPKLSPQETSISLLREETQVSPLHDAFSMIQRRLFNQDALGTAAALQTIRPQLAVEMERTRDLRTLFQAEMSLSNKLFFLSKYFKDIFQELVGTFREIFPFVHEVRISELSDLGLDSPELGRVPVLTIRERGSDHWIPVMDFSSGMLKVLLILSDLFIMPEGGVYLIDEYENSLGLNAIDFFPDFVLRSQKPIQFFLTSHHPYIINAIPLEDWFIFHRKGMHVAVNHGADLLERFGQSKQQAFIQLINDPLFAQGVE